MDSVKDYVELVKAPWGRMFYDLLFIQLDLPPSPKLKILDFGSGLGVTSDYYAKWHDVTAVEPNREMIASSLKESAYIQIVGGIEKVAEMESNTFDIIFCHNVLEYIEEKEPIVAELIRVLKPCGKLSIIKHNRLGRVFASAVFGNDPKRALALLERGTNEKSNYLGTQYLYENDEVNGWVQRYNCEIKQILGMRAFWALGQNNDVKHSGEWYADMLALESRAAHMSECKNAAFYNHLTIEKSAPAYRAATKGDLERIIGKEHREHKCFADR